MGVGAVLLLALVLVLGARLDWSMTVRLAAIVGLLAGGLVLLLVGFVQARRSAAAMERSIQAQADQQRASARPDRRAEIEQVQEQLAAAVETLKTSKLGRKRPGRAALYALPWYLFVGPPGAGKTSALANSGLTFPLGVDRVRGVGGTRNCDWFFSDQAILLDTAGRYVTEHEDTEEWEAFLDMLKKNRPRQPVNGVVVGISVAELAAGSPEDVAWHAGRIRRRIDELIERLGIRVPVYLVFTKCDLLTGFVEFFEDASREQREQIWGATLPEVRERQDPPVTAFDREFEQLRERLLDLRAGRLRQPLGPEDRRKVYVFPLEVAAVHDALRLFVGALFQPNPYQESPIFRGFYFTSATQEGTPVDRVLQPLAEACSLPAASVSAEAFDPARETKSYFIRDLFTDVVIPDRHLVRRTSRVVRRARWLRRAGVAAALVLLSLGTLGASRALLQSKQHLDQVRRAAVELNTIRWDQPHAAPAYFARLDRLRTHLAALDAGRGDRPRLRWGLYRGADVLEPARGLYHDATRRFVWTYPFRVLQENLRRVQADRTLEGLARDTLYQDLKAYLLLTGETGRLTGKANRRFLQEHLTRRSGLLEHVDPAARDTLRRRIEAQVAAWIEGVAGGSIEPFTPRPSLIAKVRTQIYEPPSIEGLYAQIKEEGQTRFPALTLGEMLKGGAPLFETGPQVEGFFTRSAWDRFVEDAIAAETERPDRADWVMGYTTEDLPASMRDPREVAEALYTLYFDEYATAWERLLQDARLRPFGNVRGAARALRTLGSPYDSPLLEVLTHVTRQTRFEGGALDEVKDRLEEGAARAAERQARRHLGRAGRVEPRLGDDEGVSHPVDRRFQWLHELSADKARSGNAAPALMSALQALAQVGARLDGFVGEPARAAGFAAAVLQDEGGELEEALSRIREALPRFDPAARRQLFERSVPFAWHVTLAEAQQHLDARWRAEVYQAFQAQIAGRYPIDLGSERDLPLRDFERFFGPHHGVVAAFAEETLAPFGMGDRRAMRTWKGRGLRLSPAARRALDQAARIGDALFDGEVLQLAFALQPETPAAEAGAPPVSQVYVEVHGRHGAYGMGSYRPWTEFVWPGRVGAVLRVTTREGDLSPGRFGGDWAWFRLLQQARVERRSATQYEVRWPFERGITVRYHLRADRADRLFSDPKAFFHFQCPEALGH